jgi:hypothetical protein
MTRKILLGEVSLPLTRIFRNEMNNFVQQQNSARKERLTWEKSWWNGFEPSEKENPELILSLGYEKFFDIYFHPENNQQVSSYCSVDQIIGKPHFGEIHDPNRHFSMYSGTPFVLMVDTKSLGNIPVPETWSDLLNDCYFQKIIAPGRAPGISYLMLLHYCRYDGMEAMRRFAQNVFTSNHATGIIRMAYEGQMPAPVAIVPWYFAMCTNIPGIIPVWPNDGAIWSPMWITIKKSASPETIQLVENLCFGRFATEAMKFHFPFADFRNPELSGKNKKMIWPGWDFFSQIDEIGRFINNLRKEVQLMKC